MLQGVPRIDVRSCRLLLEVRHDRLDRRASTGQARSARLVRPGGVGFDLEQRQVDDLRARLFLAREELKEAVELLWDTPTVVERFEKEAVGPGIE